MMNTAEIHLVCGSGGVGKTTVSAALGLKRARAGKKVIVLTIDPARRLASSLGITELGDEPREITISSPGKGRLFAMMLDTKRTFDRLVDRYATDAAGRDRILNNKIYKHLSKMLAGTQEYMAMERLYDIVGSGEYEVIIVDTPPMQNARDFLIAPERMTNMISNSMLHILLKPGLALGKTGLRFLEKGSKIILKIFDRIAGFAFLQDISEMLIAFQGMLGGFESRAREVSALLAREGTQFLAVCTAAPNSLVEIIEFKKQLDGFGYALERVIVNRAYVGPELSQEQVRKDREQLADILDDDSADVLTDNYLNYLPLLRRDRKALENLARQVGGKRAVTTIPLFNSDVHDLEGLEKIAGYL